MKTGGLGPLFTSLYGMPPGLKPFGFELVPLRMGVPAKAVFMTPIEPEPCLTPHSRYPC